ncbi:transmembrane O-methyltransferase [Aegotheles albertisi]
MVSPAIALAFLPLLLTLLLRYRHHLALLVRAARAALRERLTGVPREHRALQFLLTHAVPGDPRHVLSTLERWGQRGEPLPCLGPDRGRIVERLVRGRCPRWALELGWPCGAGAVLLARALPPGARLCTVERDPRNAPVTLSVIRLAGYREPRPAP